MIKENLIGLFEEAFKKNWELPGYTNYGEETTLTYGGIAKRIAKLHLLFEQCEIRKNDKIALIGRNTSNWAIAYIATITYGAVIIPILQDFNVNDIHHIANHSEAKLLFVSDQHWESIDGESLQYVKAVFSLTSFHCITLLNQPKENPGTEHEVDKGWDARLLQPDSIKQLFNAKYPNGFGKSDIRYPEKPNSELASINYTSGTTGFSKGVMTPCNALAGNITFGFATGLLEQGYRLLSFLPLAHAYGCAFEFLTATCAGCHIYFLGKTPAPKILLKAFSEVRPDVIFAVPLIIEKIYKKQIQPLLAKPSMRWVLSIPFLDKTILAQIRKKLIDALGGNFSEVVIGGAPLNAEVEEFFHKIKFPFTVGYGMTECAPIISYANHRDFVVKSSGRIWKTMEARIDDPNPDGVGEICVRGENVMMGYYKNEEASKGIFDKDGWLYTGDLGTVDKNENIFIRGRNKTMILSASGQNIYPEEIESKLNNMPYVMESIVIENNGKLIALVCPDYEAADAENLNQQELAERMELNRKELNKVVASYETVSKIKLYPNEFEKTPKKSIKRYLYSSGYQA